MCLLFTFLLVNNNKVGITNKKQTLLHHLRTIQYLDCFTGILEIKRESTEEQKIGTWGFIILLSLYFCVCSIFSIIKKLN